MAGRDSTFSAAASSNPTDRQPRSPTTLPVTEPTIPAAKQRLDRATVSAARTDWAFSNAADGSG
jgi:hypothetical protein